MLPALIGVYMTEDEAGQGAYAAVNCKYFLFFNSALEYSLQ
jgi:hypothetical protein